MYIKDIYLYLILIDYTLNLKRNKMKFNTHKI